MKKITVQTGYFRHPSGLVLEIRESGAIILYNPDKDALPDWLFKQLFKQPSGKFDGIGTSFIREWSRKN